MGEAIFAFIDQISSASSEGHAFEESLAARELAERRRLLLDALMSDPQPPPEELEPLVTAASWTWPETLGALVWEADEPDRVAGRMPPDTLVGRVGGDPWALVPDPSAPGRRAELERALRDTRGAIGPGVHPSRIADSARRAQLALGLKQKGPLLVADDHLLELVVRSDPGLAHDLERHALAPLDELPESQRERLLETLVAWLDAQGEARPAAERLHVHVQTVRYRVGQLEDILGDRLEDPRGRLELQLALLVRFG
jgi:hypothetical protein